MCQHTAKCIQEWGLHPELLETNNPRVLMISCSFLQLLHLASAHCQLIWRLVVVQEPADPTEVLYQLPNVVATPHTGATSTAVYDDMAKLLTQNVIRHCDGLDLLHRLV